MMSKPMVRLAQTVHLSFTNTNTISKWTKNKIPKDPRHLVVPSGASKPIFEPMVRLTQSVHLYGTDANTISK